MVGVLSSSFLGFFVLSLLVFFFSPFLFLAVLISRNRVYLFCLVTKDEGKIYRKSWTLTAMDWSGHPRLDPEQFCWVLMNFFSQIKVLEGTIFQSPGTLFNCSVTPLVWPGFSGTLGICIFLYDAKEWISEGPWKAVLFVWMKRWALYVRNSQQFCQGSWPLLSIGSVETKFRGNACIGKAHRLPQSRYTILGYNSQKTGWKNEVLCCSRNKPEFRLRSYTLNSQFSHQMGNPAPLWEPVFSYAKKCR